MTFKERVEIGEHVLYLGDCREILPTLQADAVVTDPPYGVGFKYEGYGDSPEAWFSSVLPAIEVARSRAKSMACCMSTRRLFDLPRPDGFVFWAHPGSTRRNTFGGFSECEPISIYGRWSLPNDYRLLPDCVNHASTRFDHPCPKPSALMEWLVSGIEGKTILDPFMGSGTTGVACAKLGRKFIGVEIHEPYFRIACRRLHDAVNGGVQPELF